MPTEKAKQLLKLHEGLKLNPYRDTTGHLTIGYGRNLDDKGITVQEANFMLDNDIAEKAEEVRRYIPWSRDLTRARQDVLIMMCFNLGIHGLLAFRNFLRALKRGDYKEAASHGLDSKWARQVGRRAEHLMKVIEHGDHDW